MAETTEPMQTSLSRFPDLDSLTAGLTSVLRADGTTAGRVMVLHREPCLWGTFTKEIVTCRFEDGAERRLLCKYEADLADPGVLRPERARENRRIWILGSCGLDGRGCSVDRAIP